MKKVDTCIRHSCQVLILILYETACVQKSSTHRYSIINETSSIIHGEEDKPLHLQCPFNVTNTVLKRNGRIVKESRFGALVHSLILRKEDHNSTLSCETYTSAGRKSTKNTAILDIRYKPFLSMNFTSDSVFEGQSVTLCCSSESRPPTMEIGWNMGGRMLSYEFDTDVLCHKIINISREDSGRYKCFAENKIGTRDDEVHVTVLYPPNIPDTHINFTDTDVLRTLQCLAYGVPAKYCYGRWQHLSGFDEHIRYLNSSPNGEMTLPPIANKMERYQDNGIYLCTASNRVADSCGNSFQTGKTFVKSNGPPVFVEKIEHPQYVYPAKILNLKFSVYSTSDLECYNVKNKNKEIKASTQMTPVNRTTIFHGTEITVKSIKVVSSFNIAEESGRQIFTITLCNAYGNSSFVIDLKPTKVYVDEMKSKCTKIAVIVISVMLVLCVVISGITIFLKRKRNMRNNANRATEGYPIPLNHRSNNREKSTYPLTGQTNHAEVVLQKCTSKPCRIVGVENRQDYAEANASEKAMRIIDSPNVMRSDNTGYSEVWC